MALTAPSKRRLLVTAVHCAFSVILIAGLSYWLFTSWYPEGLLRLQGGMPILLWVGLATFVTGPALTFILFRPEKKSRRELTLDLALIAVIQLAAFGYGTWVLSVQRPLYLTFVHDRFFIITPQDVIGEVPENIENLARFANGPKPVFVKLSLHAQLEAQATISRFDEAPPMALLPGAYAPLAEGLTRFDQIRNAAPSENGPPDRLTVPIIGRAHRAVAVIDGKSGQLLRIEHHPSDR